MVIVIIDDWAYRIRQDGIVESTSVHQSMGAPSEQKPVWRINPDWDTRSAEATGLTINEAWIVRENLKQLTGDFPAGRVPVVVKAEEREEAISGSNLR